MTSVTCSLFRKTFYGRGRVINLRFFVTESIYGRVATKLRWWWGGGALDLAVRIIQNFDGTFHFSTTLISRAKI
jgi:hypothetical protein